MKQVIVLLALVSIPAAPPPPSQAVGVEDLAWLAGSWEGTGLGGECEEIWSGPRAGSMLGLFRLFRDGEPEFYELMLLAEDAEGLALKVKHFTPGFSAWEDKDEAVRFGFESLVGQSARFRGLTIQREGDRLRIEVRFRNADGSTRVEPFELHRRP